MGKLIQFMHPGKQPTLSARHSFRKNWNRGAHCRSFLKLMGDYSRDMEARTVTRECLAFWAEWEAPAAAVPLTSPVASNVFMPDAPSFPSQPGLQNTDPFVFDGPFIYSNCRQVKANGEATRLRELGPGDVLLFGSHLGAEFVLDTVFVIAESVAYDPSTGPHDLSSRVPRSFVEATLRPLASVRRSSAATADASTFCGPEHCNDDDESAACGPPCTGSKATTYRLYWGATPDRPVNGMFSFVPARPAGDPVVPFPRPALQLPFISPALPRNWRDCRTESIVDAWRTVADVVLKQKLVLGVSFNLPGVAASRGASHDNYL